MLNIKLYCPNYINAFIIHIERWYSLVIHSRHDCHYNVRNFTSDTLLVNFDCFFEYFEINIVNSVYASFHSVSK